MSGIGALYGDVDPIGHAVLAAKKIGDLCCRKRGNWIGVVWKDVFAGSEVVVAGLVEAHKVAAGVGKMIADESRREVSVDAGDLLQSIGERRFIHARG